MKGLLGREGRGTECKEGREVEKVVRKKREGKGMQGR